MASNIKPMTSPYNEGWVALYERRYISLINWFFKNRNVKKFPAMACWNVWDVNFTP